MTPWGGREPRRWQVEALEALRASVARDGIALVRACTGAGKSVVIAEVVAGVLAKGGTCVVSVPSDALVRQLSQTLAARVSEDRVGVFFSDKKQPERDCVVVCNPSLLKLAAIRRSWTVWIVDEANKLESDTGRAALAAFQPRYRIGMTATPFRSDERGLRSWPETLAYEYLSPQAVADKVLVPFRVEVPVCHDQSPLASRMVNTEDQINNICAAWIEKQTRPGLANASDVADAERFAKYLVDRGIPAAAVHYNLSIRKQQERIEALRTGELRCLVHVNMLSEGVDYPWLEFLVMRRPIGVKAAELKRDCVRFVQEAGRVLRASPGKTEAVFFDIHGAFSQWNLSPAASFSDLEEIASEEDKEDPCEQADRTGVPNRRPVIIRSKLMAIIERMYAVVTTNNLANPPSADLSQSRVRVSQMEMLRKLIRREAQHIPAELSLLLDPSIVDLIPVHCSALDVWRINAVLVSLYKLTPYGKAA